MCCTGAGVCTSKEGSDLQQYAIKKLESMLMESVTKLPTNSPFEAEDSTRLAWIIYDSMNTTGRVYHSMSHVFDVAKNMDDPILILSALCHDLIYFQIDKSFDEEQAQALEGVVVLAKQPLVLVPDFNDPVIASIVHLYGYTAGAEIKQSGTNEFLSAIIGVRLLKKWIPPPYLLQIASCIEATIPFRPTIDGKSPMDRLYDRLADVAKDQSQEWLVETVRMSAATANCDLCSFASDDSDFFLDSSWKLLPEARPAILEENCPMMEHLSELHSLAGRSNFLRGAVPNIFQSFRQVPSDAEMEEKQRKTHENLGLVIAYGNVRLLQLTVLVEFVTLAGEDPGKVPIRPFLRLDIAESTKPNEELTSAEQQIRHWLVHGRRTCFPWDPAVSVLGGFLFDTLGTNGISEAIEIGKSHEEGSYQVLKHLPRPVVNTIAVSLASLFPEMAQQYLQAPKRLDI